MMRLAVVRQHGEEIDGFRVKGQACGALASGGDAYGEGALELEV